MKSSLPTL